MEVWSVWLCLMMGALRTTEVEVPDPCLKERRGQIHWQRKLELETKAFHWQRKGLSRTDDTPPVSAHVLGVSAWGDAECPLNVALSWEACLVSRSHSILQQLLSYRHPCELSIKPSAYVRVYNKCEGNQNQDKHPWTSLIQAVQFYPKFKLDCISQPSAALSLFHCFQFSYKY